MGKSAIKDSMMLQAIDEVSKQKDKFNAKDIEEWMIEKRFDSRLTIQAIGCRLAYFARTEFLQKVGSEPSEYSLHNDGANR